MATKGTKPIRERLGRDDWADAALDAMLAGGLAAVAVEPLARKLGVTKGSFYWHFEDREALLQAALLRWEYTSTEAILRDVAGLSDPGVVLRALAARALDEPRHGLLELVVSSAASERVVKPILARVMDRRLAFLADILRQAGMPQDKAGRRALLAYACFTGIHHIRRIDPSRLPRASRSGLLVRDWVEGILGETP
jgi:AcrR family transcriptional regulator